MAVAYRLNGDGTVYTVVLGQQGATCSPPRATAAYALANLGRSQQADVVWPRVGLGNNRFARTSPPFGLARESHVYWGDHTNDHPLNVRRRHLGDTYSSR